MAGTRIKKGIKDYKRIIDEGKTTKDKGKEYQDFLSSLETLLNSTEELYKRDQNGQYKKMEKKDYLSISKNYSALRESCSNFVNKENKNKFEKNHLEIAKRPFKDERRRQGLFYGRNKV